MSENEINSCGTRLVSVRDLMKFLNATFKDKEENVGCVATIKSGDYNNQSQTQILMFSKPLLNDLGNTIM